MNINFDKHDPVRLNRNKNYSYLISFIIKIHKKIIFKIKHSNLLFSDLLFKANSK